MQRWIIFLVLFLFVESLHAQRGTTYAELANQQRNEGVEQQTHLLPLGDRESLLIYSFRIPQTRLAFRRINEGETNPRFQAELRMDLELRAGDRPVSRESWVDTVRTDTYEETQDGRAVVEGALYFRVGPGEHRLFHASGSVRAAMSPPAGARSNRRDANRPIQVDVPETFEEPQLILLKEHTSADNERRMTLMNMGGDSRYGEPYELLILLPPDADESWSLRVRPEPTRDNPEPLFETRLNPEDRIDASTFELLSTQGSPVVVLRSGASESPVAAAWILSIPNENWPSRPHRIELLQNGSDEPETTQTVTPRWPDMPVSLLNLDISIDMLRFIVSEDQLRQMKRGSAAEREQKWLSFWKERDPTPGTEYNELMVEYYERIDHAWESFTTPEQPGYNSDQGQTWIRLGPPQRTERSYPPGEATLERWYYPDRIILFEATTGFGDFRRIGVEER